MGFLSNFSDRLEIETPILGKALVHAAITTGSLTKWGHQETLKGSPLISISNAQLLKIGKATEEEVNKA